MGPPSPTFAAIKDKGTTWWSVEELLEFNREVEEEKTTECGDNQDCKMEFDFSLIERGPKYSALNNLLEAQFWITAINPIEETIKVLFFDEDMMLKRMGINEILQLESLHIDWLEPKEGQAFNHNDRITEGVVENHLMYDGDASMNGDNWIPAWEEIDLSIAGSEIINNTHGIINYSIFAKNNMFNAQGTFHYSSCLNAPDYQTGAECQLYFSGDQWASYFPPREQITEDNAAPSEPAIIKTVYCSREEIIHYLKNREEELTCELGKVSESSLQELLQQSLQEEEQLQQLSQEEESSQLPPQDDELPQASAEEVEDEVKEETSDSTDDADTKPIPEPSSAPILEETPEPVTVSISESIVGSIPKSIVNSAPQPTNELKVSGTTLESTNQLRVNDAVSVSEGGLRVPDTGEIGNYSERNGNGTAMPWWIIFLNTLGVLLIVWWLLPTKNEKMRKSAEKAKKSIDKKCRLR